MAAKLNISDLADVLADLTEVTKPYQLGIQLKIDLAKLDEIEKNHPKDIGRQKTEVIKHWLRNSPDASWTTLAKAVEKMGEHARLAELLEQKTWDASCYIYPAKYEMANALVSFQPDDDIWRSLPPVYLDMCEVRNILLLGKLGHGKSTLGNRMLNSDSCFKIKSQQCPQTCKGSSMLRSASRCQDYKFKVFDHDGLLEGDSSISTLSSDIPNVLNLVFFVLKQGCSFDVRETEVLGTVVREWQISEISALVLTHCERLSEKDRGKVIEQFKKDHPSVAELMGRGILAVGFPDNSHVQPGTQLSQRVEDDKKKLKYLIYSCDESVRLYPENSPDVLSAISGSMEELFCIAPPTAALLVHSSPSQGPQPHLKIESQSSQHDESTPDTNLQFLQIEPTRSDSHKAQMNDRISQHSQTQPRRRFMCSIL